MTECILFAHSTKTLDESDWEPFQAHVAAVAAKAAENAEAFGASEFGKILGLLHDAGKVSDEFQARLRGSKKSVDHSTAGAKIAIEKYGEKIGKLMAFCIAGHHAGLANGLKNEHTRLSSLERRLTADIPTYFKWKGEITLPSHLLLKLAPKKDATGFQCAFFTRMLFSSLVDADFLETEKFYNPEIERGVDVNMSELKAQLDTHLEAFETSAIKSNLNQQRSRILAQVRANAALDPGLFSLSVPTGGGKTLASLAFALDHAIQHNLRRVIVVIPFTSIVEQTAEVFRKALGSLGDLAVLEHHSAFETDSETGQKPDSLEDTDEAGERVRRSCENWDAPIIVTTAVQFFESLFANRTSRCRKLHNIASSVVILDEAQTLPLHLLRPCVSAIDELACNYRASIVLCTATQPALNAPEFKGGLMNVRELAPDDLFGLNIFKRVTIEQAGDLDTDALANLMAESPQALCIVNTRKHAQVLYEAIKDCEGAVHLSTLMCARNRSEVLQQVRARLKDGQPCRVVSTSLIEAGVDISFPLVLRASTGLDSIAQAAGRCNRNGELTKLGRVIVFESSDHPAPQVFHPFQEAARAAFRKGGDPLSPDSIRDYFQELYWGKGREALDRPTGKKHGCENGILDALEDRSESFDFPFEDVASAFRMIDDIMVSVIIQFEDIRPHIETLENKYVTADAIRKLQKLLQKVIVQIPLSARGALVAAGAARFIQPDRFGERFCVLENMHLYSPTFGLKYDDPTFKDAYRLCV